MSASTDSELRNLQYDYFEDVTDNHALLGKSFRALAVGALLEIPAAIVSLVTFKLGLPQNEILNGGLAAPGALVVAGSLLVIAACALAGVKDKIEYSSTRRKILRRSPHSHK